MWNTIGVVLAIKYRDRVIDLDVPVFHLEEEREVWPGGWR